MEPFRTKTYLFGKKRIPKMIRKAWTIGLPRKLQLTPDSPFSLSAHSNLYAEVCCGPGCRVHVGFHSYSGSILKNVEVGNYCSIAGDVELSPTQHAVERFSTAPVLDGDAEMRGPIIVGHGAWIGLRTVIIRLIPDFPG